MINNMTTAAIQNRPPRVTATDPEDGVQSGVTGAAAVSLDLWAGYPTDAGNLKTPQGKVFIEFEALASTAYIRVSRTATTTTTINNGSAIAVGVPRVFYLDPTKDLFIDVIASGVGVLKWRRVGQMGERARI